MIYITKVLNISIIVFLTSCAKLKTVWIACITAFAIPPTTPPTTFPAKIPPSVNLVTYSFILIQPCSNSNKVFCVSTPSALAMAVPIWLTAENKALTGEATTLKAAANQKEIEGRVDFIKNKRQGVHVFKETNIFNQRIFNYSKYITL